MQKDEIYRASMARIADFRFDEQVAEVFPDMIERSVPGYRSILTAIETMARHYARKNTVLYDLGASLGAASLALLRGSRDTGCRIFAVDNSHARTQHFRMRLSREKEGERVLVLEEDILRTDIRNASMVVLNFTLQFIPRAQRSGLLQKICGGLLEGGALILSEKIRFEDTHLQERMTELHHDFKRANGYSELEISRKRSALERVLIPETIATHRERLLQAGFSSCDVYFQCFNFMSMLAVK
jgi:tRNA (cmo5U34)-methyltransferase